MLQDFWEDRFCKALCSHQQTFCGSQCLWEAVAFSWKHVTLHPLVLENIQTFSSISTLLWSTPPVNMHATVSPLCFLSPLVQACLSCYWQLGLISGLIVDDSNIMTTSEYERKVFFFWFEGRRLQRYTALSKKSTYVWYFTEKMTRSLFL